MVDLPILFFKEAGENVIKYLILLYVQSLENLPKKLLIFIAKNL